MKKAKWVVSIQGNRTESFEISIVRDDNEHGKESWGWNDIDRKIIILDSSNELSEEDYDSEGDLCENDEETLSAKEYDKFTMGAQVLADFFNGYEAIKNEHK